MREWAQQRAAVACFGGETALMTGPRPFFCLFVLLEELGNLN